MLENAQFCIVLCLLATEVHFHTSEIQRAGQIWHPNRPMSAHHQESTDVSVIGQ